MNEEKKETELEQEEPPEVTAEEENVQAEEIKDPRDQEIAEYQQRIQRLYADFDNYKKRTVKERTELIKSANEDLILQLLPVLDNLERACSSAQKAQQTEALLTGIEMVIRQMKEVLEKSGVEAVEETGIAFDPYCHQAIMQVDCDGVVEENTVVEILQKGYRLNNKTIRPAMVKVAKGN